MDFLSTPETLSPRVLSRAGCNLHYWLGGPADAPLVALLHGATMDHRMFNAQVEALRHDYRVLVWDARGHGKSKPLGDGFTLETCVEDLIAILDELDVQKATIVGQSLGGYIAQYAYLMHAERILAAVIIGATPIAKAYSRVDMGLLRLSLPLMRLWPYRHLQRTFARATAVTAQAQEYALAACRQVDRKDFLAIWKAVTFAVSEEGEPDFRFEVPLLLLHGDQDRTGSIRRDMPVWAQRQPEAQYHVLPDAGHNANQDAPELTNDILLEFLDRNRVQRSSV